MTTCSFCRRRAVVLTHPSFLSVSCCTNRLHQRVAVKCSRASSCSCSCCWVFAVSVCSKPAENEKEGGGTRRGGTECVMHR